MSKAKKTWSASFGSYGRTVRVAEQARGGMLYLFWIDNLGKQRKRSLRHRDRKRGKAEAKNLAARLEKLAEEQFTVTASHSVRSGPALRLSEGIDRAFDPVNGMYPTETQFTREARRLAMRAVKLLGDPLWTDLKPKLIRSLVRRLARKSETGEGARTAEYMCDVLYLVAGWLRDEELLPADAARPTRQWKVKLKAEWEAITGCKVQPRRPRHTKEEAAKLFRALPEADPRLRLLIEMAAELRSGQAVRARRSDLDLSEVGGFELGRFTVRGSGRKHGEVVHLHPEVRSLIDEVLTTGYLADAEAAFERGQIEDYYLFPRGRLKGGRAHLRNCVAGHLGPTAIRHQFRKLESIAGVEHQDGRSFYGLRRLATDIAADLESDDRVLDRLTGHLDSETRKRVYQDRLSEGIRARAAVARRNLREAIVGSDRDAA